MVVVAMLKVEANMQAMLYRNGVRMKDFPMHLFTHLRLFFPFLELKPSLIRNRYFVFVCHCEYCCFRSLKFLKLHEQNLLLMVMKEFQGPYTLQIFRLSKFKAKKYIHMCFQNPDINKTIKYFLFFWALKMKWFFGFIRPSSKFFWDFSGFFWEFRDLSLPYFSRSVSEFFGIFPEILGNLHARLLRYLQYFLEHFCIFRDFSVDISRPFRDL